VSYVMWLDLKVGHACCRTLGAHPDARAQGSIPTWIANFVSKKQPLCIAELRALFLK
jgi:hypothetical protein